MSDLLVVLSQPVLSHDRSSRIARIARTTNSAAATQWILAAVSDEH
jgi:hypothetical protein